MSFFRGLLKTKLALFFFWREFSGQLLPPLQLFSFRKITFQASEDHLWLLATKIVLPNQRKEEMVPRFDVEPSGDCQG